MTQADHSTPAGGDRIRLDSPEERRDWARRLGVGEDELVAIVQRIGDQAAVVEDYVRGASSPH